MDNICERFACCCSRVWGVRIINSPQAIEPFVPLLHCVPLCRFGLLRALARVQLGCCGALDILRNRGNTVLGMSTLAGTMLSTTTTSTFTTAGRWCASLDRRISVSFLCPLLLSVCRLDVDGTCLGTSLRTCLRTCLETCLGCCSGEAQ